MRSPFLYFADERLSVAELTAACLDGDLVELGDAYMPADAVETTALRAGSLRTLLGDTLAATHLSAAWIHGMLPDPPARHTVQRAVSHRLHQVVHRRLVYRDPWVGEDGMVRIGGVWVTSPARTLADIVRVTDERHASAARSIAPADPALCAAALAFLVSRGPVPNKRAGIALLQTLAAAADQDDVTR